MDEIGAGCLFGGQLDVAGGILGQAAGREMPADVLGVLRRLIADRPRDDDLLAASVFGAPHADVVRGPLAEERIERVGEADLVLGGGEGLPAGCGDVIDPQRGQHDDPFPGPGRQCGLHRLQLRQGLVGRQGLELIADLLLGQRGQAGAFGLRSAGLDARHLQGDLVLPGLLGRFGKRRFVRVAAFILGDLFARILPPHPHR